MSCSGLANVLSGVALMCADLVGTDLPGGSYRYRQGPPQVVDREVSGASTNDYYRGGPVGSARLANARYREGFRMPPRRERLTGYRAGVRKPPKKASTATCLPPARAGSFLGASRPFPCVLAKVS